MAKRHRNSIVTTAFHYLVKTVPNEDDAESPIELPFTAAEFSRVIARISRAEPLDETLQAVIDDIKSGRELPFSGYEEVEPGLHFGNFDGAYYGQQYRNNLYGTIPADSLNLRPFNYLITLLGDGKILVGVTYHGQFGDYEGLRSCLTHLLRIGNYQVTSRTIKSISSELGHGTPTELRLNYRKNRARPEHKSLFDSSGVIAIKNVEYGDGFGDEVSRVAERVRGTERQRRQILAEIVNQGQFIELNSDDIIGCSAIVREHGRTRTVYFLGENNFATKFSLDVEVDVNGTPNRDQLKAGMIEVMRERIIPLLV